MRPIYRSLSVFLLIVALSFGAAFAQKDTTKLNQSVEVMKAYRPSISNANKVNLMPSITDTTRFSPEFMYSIESYPVSKGFAASPISAADVNKSSYKNLGAGYLKLGAGTYSTPYGELFLNLPESKTAVFGLHIRHLSSNGKTKLREGDLVFFKIGRGYISHVGVYLSNNKFIHATSYGRTVTVSDLDEAYYKRYYFSAGRYL